METDTQDTTGTVLAERPVSVSQAGAGAGTGAVPGRSPPCIPQSRWRKVYELARKGQEVERPSSPGVTIHSLTLEERMCGGGRRIEPPTGFAGPVFKGDPCGTSVSDIGRALGCGAALMGLRGPWRRVQAGGALPLGMVPRRRTGDPASGGGRLPC